MKPRQSCTHSWAIVLLAGMSLVAASGAQAGIVLYVDADATGTVNDGSSWCEAYLLLQEALAAAIPGTEIRVANGKYTPAAPNGGRSTSFALQSGVAILGGFAGCSAPDPDARDFVANESILSGDLNGDDNGGGSNAENSYHVVSASGVDGTALLEGFTITGGHANGANPSDRGGGIFLFPTASSPTIRQCIIRDHVVLTKGGGVYSFANTGVFEDCDIHDNTATDGGGVYNLQGSPTYRRCTIANNFAGALGGGVFNLSSDATFDACVLADNQALGGGGMQSVTSEPLITECLFLANVAVDGFNSTGGGLLNQESGGLVVDSIFNGNFAERFGGGAHNSLSSFATFLNCAWVHNQAGAGGGLTTGSSDTVVRNGVLWDNTDEDGLPEPAQLRRLSGTLTLDYSCVEGLTGDLAGTGNIGSDPLFENAAGDDGQPGTVDDDIRLQIESPCVNSGDPAFVVRANNYDFLMKPRLVCDRIDMGPHEQQDESACAPEPVPAVSTWGLLVLLLSLAIGLKIAQPTRAQSIVT